MYMYNVDFSTKDWHIGTTVVADNHEDAAEKAEHFLTQTARIQVSTFAVAVNVEYVGEAI
jgi:hypothetical protein